jgi:hypothetical protein
MIVLGSAFSMVEEWSKPFVGFLAIAPSVIALVAYFGLRASKLTNWRMLATGPLGFGFFLGLKALIDLGRPGNKEFLGVGFKTMQLYNAVVVIPVLALGFIIFQEWRLARLANKLRVNPPR